MINGDRPTLGPNAGRKARKTVRRALGAASDALGLARCTGRAQTRPSTTGIREMSVYSRLRLGLGRRPMNTFKRNTLRQTSLVFVVVAALLVTAVAFGAQAQAPSRANAPWYPSLQAFEHYDSGRSHVFSMARFGGSFRGPNTVEEVRSAEGTYPSGYNMSYLNKNAAFIQGGSYGDVPGSIGPFVAKVDPQTLAPIWYQPTGTWSTRSRCRRWSTCATTTPTRRRPMTRP